MREYTDCVNQKIKGGAVSICPTCIHHNICKVIDNQPCIECSQFIRAADVRPVVRGKWEQTTQPMGWHEEECATCSVCGEDFVLDEWAMDEFTNLMHFCPNCGADMREVEE